MLSTSVSHFTIGVHSLLCPESSGRLSGMKKSSDKKFSGLDIPNENNWWGDKLSVRITRDEKKSRKEKLILILPSLRPPPLLPG